MRDRRRRVKTEGSQPRVGINTNDAIAIPTLRPFARHSQPKPRFPILCSKPLAKTKVSKAALRSTAKQNVTAHVSGLKVPKWNKSYSRTPGNNSQTRPRAGMRKMPSRVEAAFIARSPRTATGPQPRLHQLPRRPAEHLRSGPMRSGRLNAWRASAAFRDGVAKIREYLDGFEPHTVDPVVTIVP